MDPSWETCPYCEAEERSRQLTRDGLEADFFYKNI
jgi:hypothetical protein